MSEYIAGIVLALVPGLGFVILAGVFEVIWNAIEKALKRKAPEGAETPTGNEF